MPDWITAISTLIMTIATFAIAVIAWQAKDTWRKKIKERKIHDLIIKLQNITKEIDRYICDIYDIPINKLYYKSFEKLLKQLKNIKDEYKYLASKADIKIIENLIEKIEVKGDTYNYVEYCDENNIDVVDESFTKDFFKKLKDKETYQKIQDSIQKIYELCDKKIENFYT